MRSSGRRWPRVLRHAVLQRSPSQQSNWQVDPSTFLQLLYTSYPTSQSSLVVQYLEKLLVSKLAILKTKDAFSATVRTCGAVLIFRDRVALIHTFLTRTNFALETKSCKKYSMFNIPFPIFKTHTQKNYSLPVW